MEISRTFLIRTLGCKVNQVEGEGLREKFLRRGYRESTQDTGLDVVVINTCTVTANADKRSRALVRRFHRLNPQAKILVTGCYAEKDRNQLTQLDGVHLVVTQNEKETLVDRFLESSPSFATLENPQEHFQELPISQFQGHTRGFLKVQDGCDRNCSYCKVKVVRGASRSRSFGEVKEEATAKPSRIGFGLVDHQLALDHVIAKRRQTTHPHPLLLRGGDPERRSL